VGVRKRTEVGKRKRRVGGKYRRGERKGEVEEYRGGRGLR